MDLLIMCTANICRSAMGQGLLRKYVAEQGLDAHIHSAGFLFDNRRAEPYAVETVKERGIDIKDHRSRIVDAAMLDEADVVLTMTREHVRDAALMQTSCFGKIFPLREYVRRASEVGARGDQPIDSWLERLGEGRSPRTYLVDLNADKIDDPIGGKISEFRACADELDLLLQTAASLTI